MSGNDIDISGASILVVDDVPANLAVLVQALEGEGFNLAVSIGWLINVLDPEAVIVGGGLGMAGGPYWDSFLASTRSHIWSDTNRYLPIMPAALGVDAGFIGAAATIFQRQASESDST